MDREAKVKLNREYIENKVNPIFEILLIDILKNKPDDVIDFIAKWVETNKNNINYKSSDNKMVNQMRASVDDTDGGKKKNKKPKNEDMPDSESESGDEFEELPEKKPLPPDKKQRVSVSAEAYGTFNKKGSYVPRVIEKTEEQRSRIIKRLSQAFMFSNLDEKDREIVINAFEEKKYSPGDWVINQGEDGDVLYVVDSGELDCFKRFTKDGENKHLKVYVPGESFGELALLYNAPRAASIQAKTDCILYSLDRDCFNNIVKESAIKKREKYDNFLKTVKLLETLDPYERSKVSEALKSMKISAGEYVVRQGEEGNDFFIVEEGELTALKIIDSTSEEPKEVKKYFPGDYFGELALLRDIPRQASVLATTDAVLIALDRFTFKRLLGPLEEMLKRDSQIYEAYNVTS